LFFRCQSCQKALGHQCMTTSRDVLSRRRNLPYLLVLNRCLDSDCRTQCHRSEGCWVPAEYKGTSLWNPLKVGEKCQGFFGTLGMSRTFIEKSEIYM
jgi:hypothetical protein